jgi:Fe-S cluster assembly protein SufD
MTLLPDSLLPHPQAELRPGQAEAIEEARSRDLPTEELEEWRYSRIDDLDLDGIRPASQGDGELTGTAKELAATVEDAAVFGVIDAGMATSWRAETGEVTVFADEGVVTPTDNEDFDHLNAALTPATHTVTVRPGVELPGPVVVVDIGGAPGELAAPRLRFLADDGCTATFVHLVVARGSGVMVPVTEVIAGDDAEVRVVTITVGEVGAWVLGRLASQVGRNTRLTLNSISLGGHYQRLRLDASLDGDSSDLDNRAMYLGTGNGMHDYRVHQRHDARHTASRLTLRGAVRDESEGVFTGIVRMERGAKGAEGAQDARHLILEDGTHVDSVPNLEIEENNVVCSHASSIAPINADQEFYLESRGVPTQQAVQLIARGFLNDGLAGLRPTGLGAVIAGVVREELARPIEALVR